MEGTLHLDVLRDLKRINTHLVAAAAYPMLAADGPEPGQPTRDAAVPPRMRRDDQPAAAYTWQVAAGCVLVVVDLDRNGWRSVTNDAAGVVADLAELRPDLLARVPVVPYQDSMGCWDALSVDRKGAFAGFTPINATSEAEAVACVFLRHG